MAFQVKAILVAKDIQAASSINPDDLSGEFQNHASNVYFYAAKHGEAARQEGKAKQNLEIVTARLDNQERELAIAAKEKTTETTISNRIKMSAEFQEAQDAYLDACFINNLAKGASLAMATKRDMLVQLGASEREEMKGQLRMNAGDRSLRALDAHNGQA